MQRKHKFCQDNMLTDHRGNRAYEKHHYINHLPPRLTLMQALHSSEVKFQNLKKKGIISTTQYEILYPFHVDNMSTIDMTLWMVLARNLTHVKGRVRINWTQSPSQSNTEWQHDFIRLKEVRNYLFHASKPELNDEKFSEVKQELVATLKRLGSQEDVIQNHLSRDLDPQQTSVYIMQMRQQYLEEQWIQAARRKRHTQMLTGALALLAILVACGVAIPIYWYAKQKIPCVQNIIKIRSDSGILNFMPRSGWGALPVKEEFTNPIDRLKKPVKMAVLFHTAYVKSECLVTTDCCDVVQYLQRAQMDGSLIANIAWQDIAYNYLIGNDGVVYEGRGSQVISAAAWRRNADIVSIALLGHYVCEPPSRTALMALYVFLEYIKIDDPTNPPGSPETPILSEDYNIYGHCQVNIVTPEHNVTFRDAPGAAAMWEIRYWKHWSAENVTQCDIEKDCLTSQNCCKKNCEGI